MGSGGTIMPDSSSPISRRTVGIALAGAAAGAVGARVLGRRGPAPAAPAAEAARPAELMAVERETGLTPDATTTAYRLFGRFRGPATATPGPRSGLVSGLLFQVTTGGCWLEGYWWWVCEKGQPTTPRMFALWTPYEGTDGFKGELVPGGTVTSGKLVAGRWNFVRLPRPLPLSIGCWYVGLTGGTGGFPVTGNVWGKGNRWAGGLTSGPLHAPSDSSAALIADGGFIQCPATEGANPTKVMPVYGGYPANAYYWLDPQVTTVAPAGTSFRLWPSMPIIGGQGGRATDPPDSTEQSSGTEFWLSTAHSEYTLDKIWFWSPPASASDPGNKGAALLPGSCAIFNIATKEMVKGTQRGVTGPNPAATRLPDWRTPNGKPAKAGDGWIYCAYDGVKLPPGKYKTAVYCYGGGTVFSKDYTFFAELPFYFGRDLASGTAGVAQNGIANGPLFSPGLNKASLATGNGSIGSDPAVLPGNSTYQNNDSANTGVFLYPDTFDDKDNGEVRWVDVEVTPVATPK
jgi:hypothetical protein